MSSDTARGGTSSGSGSDGPWGPMGPKGGDWVTARPHWWTWA